MTDKAAVKINDVLGNLTRCFQAKTLFTTPYWEDVMKRVQMKIFAISCRGPCYNWVSVTTNNKNSGLLVRIQDGDKQNSAAERQKLGAD